MAVKFKKNPAPLRGALFVSNPRKKKRKSVKRRKNRLALKKNRRNPARKRRKNRLALKKNRLAMKRRNRLALKKNRRNRLAMKKNRRNGTKRGMARKTARRAYKRNRRNPMMKTIGSVFSPFNSQTFGGMKIKMLDKLAKQVSDIAPLGIPVGKLGASAIQMASPTLFGMGSGLVMSTGSEMLSKIPYIGQIFEGKFGVTFTGMALAMLSQYLPVSQETKKSLAIGFTVGAGAINGYQLVQESGGIRDALMDIYPMSGVHLGNYGSVHLGDGMAYDVQPLSGVDIHDLGAISSVHLQGHDSMYHDAKLSDSYLCPNDLSLDEGRSALAGKKSFINRFGQSPRRATQKSDSYSRHAGKEGHRWGWLIKLIGFDRFQKLCKMSPSKRMAIIKKMKQSAMQHAKMQFDQQIALKQDASPIAPQMDMSGLSVDPMAGLVSIGAGI